MECCIFASKSVIIINVPVCFSVSKKVPPSNAEILCPVFVRLRCSFVKSADSGNCCDRYAIIV